MLTAIGAAGKISFLPHHHLVEPVNQKGEKGGRPRKRSLWYWKGSVADNQAKGGKNPPL